MLTASAPGKTILLGEYAVLEGGPALVVAIERRATCRFEPGDEIVVVAPGVGAHRAVAATQARPLPFVAALCETMDIPRGRYTVDSGALYDETGARRQKLGLGSSAASSVAFAGAALAAHGQQMDDTFRRAVFAHVMTAHHRVQGGGSGADVAASTYGGVLRYRWVADPSTTAVDGTNGLEVPGVGTAYLEPLSVGRQRILAVWTGTPADTAVFIARVADHSRRDPEGAQRSMHALAAAAEAGIDAWRATDRPALAVAAMATAATLDALGRAAAIEIVTDAHRAMRDCVKPFGGVIKPTGAGGGDLGWVITPEERDEVAALAALQRAGYVAWRLPIAKAGLRIDSAPRG